ncbi:B3 domain-containing protein At2g33720-like [Arachis duranensis]|uniref:B3 domain-containing protein At2g33720-like n=1 Tax=Arachis duranensis TaxID=130453 RepID=A0A6P4D091_ARADU|nr:B3 domain-containing protein At2g33720-like [Arachis duranensis]
MLHQITNPNLLHISLELSLISSSFQQSKATNHGGSRNLKARKEPNQRNPKKSCFTRWGCSTSLELYDNPWKIKKKLTTSDLGKLNRLLFGSNLLENLMVPVLSMEAQREASCGMGTPIRVWDVDTMSMHYLILKRWASFKSYVLIGKWNKEFVRRRELKKGDVVGLHWDSYRQCFNFSVLKHAGDRY